MIELQDIFNLYADDYCNRQKLPVHVLKAVSAIKNCRTSALGYHKDICHECGNEKISYNSCRNRHCPKCQSLTKEAWIDSQKYNLLNVQYFHVVFTIPDILNTIAFQNQKIVYNILFKAVAETLQELSLDKKYLGATLGFTSVLHTWGQNLMHHPHIHCIVPGGGLSKAEKWLNTKKKFFIPVKVLSRKFRGKFLFYLKQAKLNFYNDTDLFNFKKLTDDCYKKEWIVYCKPPFKSASCVVEYLGRYTHRVAISNNRIISINNETISFKWRDYRDDNKMKIMTLSANEFIRRFLIHILPPRFMKIRHYGLLGNRNKNTKLKLCKKLTNTPILEKIKASASELIFKLTGIDISKCPCCGSDKLTRINCFSDSS